MSNSSLVSYTKISPNRTSPRNHVIDTITIHCVVGQLSAESICGCFISPSVQASCNYGIGADGRIALCVEEKDRSWCSSNAANDHRAITIECASDKTHPYAINSKVYAALIDLCEDICRRNGIKELKWKADKSLIGQPEKQNMTVHRWFANKACPGDYIYNRLGQIAAEVNARLGGTATSGGTQATAFKDLSELEVIAKIGPSFTADQKTSGILASVSMAQFILESGYGKSELAQNANNCFGMKASLSGNTWEGSVWDGTKYVKNTQEYVNGQYVTVSAEFRKYGCVEDSIADHSAYLLGAMNGNKKRYDGLKGCTNHEKAIRIIKDGGYATSPTYVENLLSIIDKWNLKQYDAASANGGSSEITDNSYPAVPFTVKVLIDDLNYRTEPSMNGNVGGQTGKGIFTIVQVSNGWGKLKSGAGWIWLGNASYCRIQDTVSSSESDPAGLPYTVKVDVSNLNIRKGPGTNYETTGKYTGAGIFTIVEVKAGAGSNSGWGKLKSGAGWISLDFTTRI